MLEIIIQDDGLATFTKAVKALGSSKAKTAYTRALNKTGQMALTRVKRVVAEQMGTTQANVVRYGELRRIPANGVQLQTRITASGREIPTKAFGARLTKSGVSAAPWGVRRIFPGSFFVKPLGGHVFTRKGPKVEPEKGRWAGTGVKRQKLKKHFGPSVPRELVRGESEKAFREIASTVLEQEVGRQIELITNGVVT